MNVVGHVEPSRKAIAIRFLYTLLFLVIFELLKLILLLSTLFQFIYLLITSRHSEPLRRFCNKLASYAYKIIRYITLNDSSKPFPFAEFPKELEPSEIHVAYQDSP